MTKHTAGPWAIGGFAGQHDEAGALIIAANGTCIASTRGGLRQNSSLAEWESYHADARLIAAAPDLLEALKPFAAFICVIPDATQSIHRDDAPLYSFDNVTFTYGQVHQAAAAISKALGHD